MFSIREDAVLLLDDSLASSFCSGIQPSCALCPAMTTMSARSFSDLSARACRMRIGASPHSSLWLRASRAGLFRISQKVAQAFRAVLSALDAGMKTGLCHKFRFFCPEV